MFVAGWVVAGSVAARAQQPIGTVGLQDATVVGALEVSQGRAVLAGNTDVTAGAHVADVALSRGGSVRVCATSRLRATGGKTLAGPAPLVLALDRGAIEVHMPATASDVVMTPDLRFTLHGSGPLDLQLRVTRNGDTCVDNRGSNAPTLSVAEQFGDASYELRAGQHVLFEHGSLKEVVDHESSSCGCPPEPAPSEPAMTVADALVKAGAPAKPGPADAASPAKTPAEEHPFPAAISEGLAPAAVTPQAPAGAVHAQVSATLSSGTATDSTSVPGASAGTAAEGTNEDSRTAPGPATAPPATTQAPAPRGGVIHAVGRFFRRLIGRG